MPIYNLLENSSNYSETAGSFWFYSKDEATNCDADINNNNNLKSLEYEAEILESTVANGNNSISKNSTIAVPLKYLSNF